jgi:ribonuclease P protein component
MKKQSFGKHERIRKRKDFLKLYEDGIRINSQNFIIILSRNQTGMRRLGITVTKKVGNSVKRNRIKRLLREFFRLNKDILPDSHDIVIIVKRDIPFLKYEDVRVELERLFLKHNKIMGC